MKRPPPSSNGGYGLKTKKEGASQKASEREICDVTTVRAVVQPGRPGWSSP